MDELQKQRIINLCENLMNDYINNSIIKKTTYKATGELTYREYKIRKSKRIIDEIDDELAKYYGLSKKERDFIKNYELNFRIGTEGDNSEL